MPEPRGKLISASVGAEMRGCFSPAGEHERARSILPFFRRYEKTAGSSPCRQNLLAEGDPHPAFRKGEAENIRDGRGLPGSGIDAPFPVRGKKSAQLMQKVQQVIFSEAPEHGSRASRRRKVMLRRHIFVGHVALPVPRGGKFSAEPVVPFEQKHPDAPSLQPERTHHSRSAPADDDCRIILHK